MNDKYFMQRALTLSQKALGATSPNPLVGAVLVNSSGEIVGEGWHHKAGEAHAEVNALKMAGELARGTTAYVTLEPCSHYGRTGPCCEALIQAGVRKVFVAMVDPNPKVAGNGIRRLREAGIAVDLGLLEEEACRVNEVFLQWITTGKPFVALKYAMTLDGKIASSSGDSKWITGEEARQQSHYLRSIYDCILVGKGTILADDPELTCRLVNGKNPVRIVLDAHLEIPLTAKVLKGKEAKTIIVTSHNVDMEKLAQIKALPNIEAFQITCKNGRLDLEELLKVLGELKYTSVFVEGGSAVHGSFYDAGYVNKVYAFVAPKIIGGSEALTPIGGLGSTKIKHGLNLKNVEYKAYGQDLLISGYPVKR